MQNMRKYYSHVELTSPMQKQWHSLALSEVQRLTKLGVLSPILLDNLPRQKPEVVNYQTSCQMTVKLVAIPKKDGTVHLIDITFGKKQRCSILGSVGRMPKRTYSRDLEGPTRTNKKPKTFINVN